MSAQAADRADVDDVAGAGPAHDFSGTMRTHVWTAYVAGKLRIKQSFIDFKEMTTAHVGSVVDQQIDAAEGLQGRVKQAVNLRCAANIGRDGESCGPERTQSGGRGLNGLRCPAVNDDPHPLARQAQGDAQANAATGTGHDGYLVRQLGVTRPDRFVQRGQLLNRVACVEAPSSAELDVEAVRHPRVEVCDDLPADANASVLVCHRQLNAINSNPADRVRAVLKPARVVVDNLQVAPGKLRADSRLTPVIELRRDQLRRQDQVAQVAPDAENLGSAASADTSLPSRSATGTCRGPAR